MELVWVALSAVAFVLGGVLGYAVRARSSRRRRLLEKQRWLRAGGQSGLRLQRTSAAADQFKGAAAGPPVETKSEAPRLVGRHVDERVVPNRDAYRHSRRTSLPRSSGNT
jgi:hypothetical protein